MEVAEFQRWMDELYGDRDRRRGQDRTFGWFVEEVGELSRALRRGTPENLRHEFADVVAWLASLANSAGVDLQAELERYRDACPRCSARPCACPYVE